VSFRILCVVITVKQADHGRLGQKHETSVYCYYTQDTVEARILASNVRNGTSIYLKPSDAESGMAESNMAHVAAGASKGGDLGASEGEDRDLELLSLIL
jgi:E3 ubiquitin-protein ligase SHPRH